MPNTTEDDETRISNRDASDARKQKQLRKQLQHNKNRRTSASAILSESEALKQHKKRPKLIKQRLHSEALAYPIVIDNKNHLYLPETNEVLPCSDRGSVDIKSKSRPHRTYRRVMKLFENKSLTWIFF